MIHNLDALGNGRKPLAPLDCLFAQKFDLLGRVLVKGFAIRRNHQLAANIVGLAARQGGQHHAKRLAKGFRVNRLWRWDGRVGDSLNPR